MISTFRRQFSPLRSVSASLALLAFAGCESDRPRRGPPAPEAGAAAPAPAPEMSAHATFFAGQLETEVLLNRTGFGPRGNGKDGPPPDGEGRGRGGFGGGFGGGGKRGGGSRGGGGGAPPGDSRGTTGHNADGEPVPRIVASNQPPVQLHLRLTNHGSEPVDVEVLDFNSDLGNFVVQPKKITLAPNASAEAEPMTSRLGVPGDSIPLTIRIRENGRIEKQIIALELIAPPAAVPPPPPAPPAGIP